MAPAVNEVPIDSVPLNEDPPTNNEEIEGEVEICDIEKVKEDEEMHDEAMGILPIHSVLAQQIMSFLKGLDGPRMTPSTESPTNPPIARTTPKTSDVEGNHAFFHPLLYFVMTSN